MAMSLVGAGLIVASIALLDRNSAFPGLNALPAVAGAAFLVWPRAGGVVQRLLSLPPVVFTGKISYSLYLWHWPIVVLYGYFTSGSSLSISERLVLLVASCAIAALSWRFVEQPFRQRTVGLSPRRVVAWGVGAAVVTSALAMAVVAGQGFYSRLDAEAQVIAQFLETPGPQRGPVCFITSDINDANALDPACIARDATKPTVLVVGDSHSNHLLAGLRAAFPELHFGQAAASGCLPVLEAKGERRCTEVMARVFGEIVPQTKFDAIIVSARWVRGGWQEMLPDTVSYLAKFAPIIVVGQNVEYASDLPSLLLARSFLRWGGGDPDKSAKIDVARSINATVAQAVAEGGGQFVDLLAAYCTTSCRPTTDEGLPMLSDYNHMSGPGSRFIIARLRKMGLTIAGIPDVATPERLASQD